MDGMSFSKDLSRTFPNTSMSYTNRWEFLGKELHYRWACPADRCENKKIFYILVDIANKNRHKISPTYFFISLEVAEMNQDVSNCSCGCSSCNKLSLRIWNCWILRPYLVLWKIVSEIGSCSKLERSSWSFASSLSGDSADSTSAASSLITARWTYWNSITKT